MASHTLRESRDKRLPSGWEWDVLGRSQASGSLLPLTFLHGIPLWTVAHEELRAGTHGDGVGRVVTTGISTHIKRLRSFT